MTPARREARIAMLRRGITIDTLAAEIGYSPTTIHNVLSNASVSPSARQAITNALQVEDLWPGVKVTERRFTFPAATEIEFPSVKQSRDGFDEVIRELGPGSATRRGRVVTFKKTVVGWFPITKLSAAARNRKISASSNE